MAKKTNLSPDTNPVRANAPAAKSAAPKHRRAKTTVAETAPVVAAKLAEEAAKPAAEASEAKKSAADRRGKAVKHEVPKQAPVNEPAVSAVALDEAPARTEVPNAAGQSKPPATVEVNAASVELDMDAPAAEPSFTITHDDIATLAFSYWERRGHQGGSPEEDWRRAEEELVSLLR